MLDKLEKIIAKYESLREESLSPEVFQNPEKSKVQFSSDVSNKKVDIDFYHNRGKDSNLDLRALENLEKIEISDDSEEEEIKVKKKKKKSKKKKKNKGEKDDSRKKSNSLTREDINPDVANIEITQEDDDDDEGKSSKKKKKKKDKSKKEEQDEDDQEEEFTE